MRTVLIFVLALAGCTSEPLKIELPMGGSLKAFTDISKGIPTDCSMVFNLMVQLAPMLASIECLVRVLKLLAPLIEVIKGAPPASGLTRPN